MLRARHAAFAAKADPMIAQRSYPLLNFLWIFS